MALLRLPARHHAEEAEEPKKGSKSKKPEVLPFVIMGLDVSLRHTGVVVLDAAGRILRKETLENPKDNDRSKLGDYNGVVRPLLILAKTFTYAPPYLKLVVAKEDYAFAEHSSSDTPLKELGGILEWEFCKLQRLVYMAIPIASAKKWMTGKGTADKDDMIICADRRFGVVNEGEHVCDALAVATMTLESIKPGTFKTEAVNRDAVKTLAARGAELKKWVEAD